jgi:hypothetical protein
MYLILIANKNKQIKTKLSELVEVWEQLYRIQWNEAESITEKKEDC